MFTPDLDLRVTTRCSVFQVLDKTGVDTGDGTKWEGGTGLDVTDLTYANIRVVDPSGNYTDHDVLSQIPDPVTGQFWFDDMDATESDGLHNLVYTLQTSDFNITAFGDYSGTVNGTIVVTAAGHGLTTGYYVEITGSTNYNGIHYVTRIDNDSFYITGTFVVDDGACTGTTTLRSTFYPYVFCRSEAGVEKMFSNIAQMVPGATREKYLDDALTAWGLLTVLKSAITSANVTALDDIQAEITQILEYYDVDANL